MQTLRLWLLIMLLTGCTSSSPPTQYFLMNPDNQAEVLSQTEVNVAVGPVLVPDYLQRKAIAIRRSEHQLAFSSSVLWASPLQQQLPALLRQSLQPMLPSVQLIPFPQTMPVAGRSSLQLMVEILKFDGRPGGEVELSATWLLGDKANAQVLTAGHFQQRIDTTGADYEQLVQAHNLLFNQFTRQMAEAIANNIN